MRRRTSCAGATASVPAACDPRAARPIWSPTPTWRPSPRSGRCSRARRPGDAILGEEGGETTGRASFAGSSTRSTERSITCTGSRAFAVSIACEDASGTLAGVVLDPISGERFEATRSGEPTLNGDPIQSDGRAESLDLAMVATGFNYDSSVRARQANVMVRLLPRVRDIRRVGAAALDLCWCACGRYDAYFERGLNPWDVAAGRPDRVSRRIGCARSGRGRRAAGGHGCGAGCADRRPARADLGLARPRSSPGSRPRRD